MNAPTPPLRALEAELRAAKQAERAAADHRLAVEAQILAHFTAPEAGEGTAKDGDLTVTWKLTRKVDTEALQDAWVELNPNTQKAFKWKADVDLKQLRALADLDADGHAAAARFITTTPAKPAITLKEQA